MRRIVLIFALGLIHFSGCGHDPEIQSGTVFDSDQLDIPATTPPDFVSHTTNVNRGIRARIKGVAEKLFIPEEDVITTSSQDNKVLSATGTADDNNTLLLLSFTVSNTVTPPILLKLVSPASLSVTATEAIFSYNESGTSGSAITWVSMGVLDLEKWNDDQVEGTFGAEIIMDNNSIRVITDGTIDVHFNQ